MQHTLHQREDLGIYDSGFFSPTFYRFDMGYTVYAGATFRQMPLPVTKLEEVQSLSRGLFLPHQDI